ncbi:hypothetical protein SDC9_160331 [bioreactor metagenome]|uniref:Uncharacterized protein n=1 Tax=bioreactor metagenome TaxID=1076179 RepID=A0A645FF64_9ZZZZ
MRTLVIAARGPLAREYARHNMKKRDSYILGSHHFATHFWSGMVFGAVAGVCSGAWWFDLGGWKLAGFALLFAVILAYLCGKWGDRAWEVILSILFY